MAPREKALEQFPSVNILGVFDCAPTNNTQDRSLWRSGQDDEG